MQVQHLFLESKTILQSSINSQKGVLQVTCQVHVVIFVTAVDISWLDPIGKARCQARVVHGARVLTETSAPSTARGVVTKRSFSSALQLGKDC